MSDSKPGLFELEKETVGQIPDSQRHGTSRSLVAIWGGMNMTPLTVVTGATATTVLGLPIVWSIIAILIGHILGGIGMALHAAQGPQLGVPQMLQARGQFGTYGSVIIVFVATMMFVGYFASNLLIAAQSITAVYPVVDTNTAVVLGILASFGVAIFGYRLVRFATAISAVVVGALILVTFIALGFVEDWSAILSRGHFSLVGFSSMVAIGVVWQLTYAPYVSDYSRYMPKDSGTSGAFWGSYIGCVGSSTILMILGCIVGLASVGDNTMAGLNSLLGANLGLVVLAGFALAAWMGNAVNAYCSCLCALTLVETFAKDWNPGLRARISTTVVLHILGLAIALASATAFANVFFNFLSILLYILIPWSAINLVDYYLIRHGSYNVADFYASDGGRYGRWNTAAMLVFAGGVAVQLPFLVTTFYTGPLAVWMSGIDVAWLVGLAASGLGYLLLAKYTPGLCRLEPVMDAVPQGHPSS